jgi:hypothetical protein
LFSAQSVASCRTINEIDGGYLGHSVVTPGTAIWKKRDYAPYRYDSDGEQFEIKEGPPGDLLDHPNPQMSGAGSSKGSQRTCSLRTDKPILSAAIASVSASHARLAILRPIRSHASRLNVSKSSMRMDWAVGNRRRKRTNHSDRVEFQYGANSRKYHGM